MSTFGGQDVIADWAINFGAQLDDMRTGLATMVSEVTQTTAQVQGRARVTGGAFAAMGRRGTAAFGLIAKGAGIALGAIVAMKAAVDLEELSNRRLARSLDIAGESATGAQDDFNNFAKELDQFTSLSENTIRKIAGIGASVGKLTGEDLKQATVASVGLSARYEHLGLSAEQAAKLIAKAANGDFSGFERFGIVIDENLSGMDKYQLVINEGLRGLEDADDQAQTTTGGFRRLLGAVTELAAAAGRLLGLGGEAGGIMDVAIEGINRLTAWLGTLQVEVDATFTKLLKFFGFDFGSVIGVDLIIAQVQNIFDGMTTQLAIWMGTASNTILGWLNTLPGPVKDILFGASGDLTVGGMVSDVDALESDLDRRQRDRLREAQQAQDKRLREAEKGADDFANKFRFISGRGIDPKRTSDSIQSVIGTFSIPGADEANRLRRQILAAVSKIGRFLDIDGHITDRRRTA